jgi:hypothetical protein
MAILSGKLDFWWGTVFVSYGKKTRMDKVGCDGMYVENIHFKSKIHMLLFLIYRSSYGAFIFYMGRFR